MIVYYANIHRPVDFDKAASKVPFPAFLFSFVDIARAKDGVKLMLRVREWTRRYKDKK